MEKVEIVMVVNHDISPAGQLQATADQHYHAVAWPTGENSTDPFGECLNGGSRSLKAASIIFMCIG